MQLVSLFALLLKSGTPMLSWLIVAATCLFLLHAPIHAETEAGVPSVGIPLEAEAMHIENGWKVIRDREGYFPSGPGAWSRNRLRASEDDQPATAWKTVQIERAGTYHLWVRYESAAGFDSLFTVTVDQGDRRIIEAPMGGREQAKYFPFGRGWRVQGIWGWHNSDHIYQKVVIDLEAGPARITLSKDRNGHPAAARVVDLFYLTDDLLMQPGDDYPVTRSNILTRFNAVRYIKVRVAPEASGPALVYFDTFRFDTWRTSGVTYVTVDGLTEPETMPRRLYTRRAPSAEARLTPGAETAWLPIELSTVMPGRLLARSDQPAELWVSDRPDGQGAIRFTLGDEPWMADATPELQGRDIVIGTGQSRFEDRILKGRLAVSMRDYLDELLAGLESTPVVGRRTKRLGMISAFDIYIDGFDFRRIAAAAGLTGQHYRMDPEVYHPDSPDFGFDRSRSYPSMTINRWISGRSAEAFYEGDASELRAHYRSRAQAIRTQGLGDVPQSIKLLEETGPARDFRNWPEPNRLFREYLKEQGVRPVDILDRDELVAAMEAGATDEAALWERVRIGTFSAADAVSNPPLYYHSVYFRAQIFADKCAEATRIIEEETGPGTLVNTGATYINFGRQALHHGIEPFMLKSRRGTSSLFMGTSWGLGGTPEYLGPQTESYGAAVARSLAKYHDMSMGCYLISDGNRGYTPEYLELAAYAMAAGRYDMWSYYNLIFPNGCSFIGYPELLGAIRRTSHTLGPVEDRVLASKVAPARIALGWSVTTDIWDAGQPAPSLDETGTRGSDAPGNGMFPMERQYMYLMLRHLQHPVDILGEEDLTRGYLENYDIYVLIGDHLRPEAAAALKDWVARGGTLISMAGGGMQDHYGRPLDTLKDVFGISTATLRKEARALRPKAELVHAEPLDMIRLNDGTRLPAYGYHQGFKVADGQVLGRFRDGTAAIVANDHGKGRALIIGTLPGIAYLSGAFPRIPFGRGGEDLSGYIYPDYNQSVRQQVSRLFEPYLGEPPVRVSVPEVEATLHRHKETGAWSIALVNFTGRPIDELSLVLDPKFFEGTPNVRAQFGAAKRQVRDGRTLVTLPLDRFDYLYLE